MEQKEIKTREEAQEYAKKWQAWASDQSLSYNEVASWGSYFADIAERFDLEDEFKENGII